MISNHMNPDFETALSHYDQRVTRALQAAITQTTKDNTLLREAMHYATQNGGKRLRPTLVYAVGHAVGQSLEALDPIAAAIECIHTYSLIHDDLPAMDDDNLRRGKPTCHLVFGEAIAILAGDALHTLAFELLSSTKSNALHPEQQLKLIHLIASCAGSHGMIGGQALDLLSEGKTLSVMELEKMHALKTGALIKASVMAGAIGADCQEQSILQSLEQFSENIGLAFQLQDDLLDSTGVCKKIGKQTQQDQKHRKATYPILFGLENTQSQIKRLTTTAIEILQSLSIDTAFLEALCLQLLVREK